MRTATLYLSLIIFMLCLVVPSGCGKKDADVTGKDSTNATTENRKNRADAKKDVAKNTAKKKRGDVAKDSDEKETEETVVLVEVPEKTKDQILGFYKSKFEFSADQIGEADKIIMAHGAEFRDLRKKSTDLLTKEMREARAEATKKALEGGASKPDAAKAGKATLDPVTSAKLEEIEAEEDELVKKVRLEVRKILNDEQREILKKAAESNRKEAE